MAVAVKSAAFAVMLRVLLVGFGDERLMSWGTGWPPAIAVLAVLSMVVANVIAGRQESVKRMLAYSSIAHAGYVLVGVVATLRVSGEAQASVLFYLLTYTVSTAGAFGALIMCGSRGAEAVSYEDLAGVGRRHPAAALAFSLFLLSLAGIPPTAGFFGKLYVFRAAIDSELYAVAVIGLLNSVIGAYYYLRRHHGRLLHRDRAGRARGAGHPAAHRRGVRGAVGHGRGDRGRVAARVRSRAGRRGLVSVLRQPRSARRRSRRGGQARRAR
jgi:NADH-quinone oxidoreductase subunit N